ncbi:MAG: hypothetical protein U1F34_04810 [Gammaproteobacteria bacterium]
MLALCGTTNEEVLACVATFGAVQVLPCRSAVCRQCLYDTGVAKHCRETIADEVQDKTRANFAPT